VTQKSTRSGSLLMSEGQQVGSPVERWRIDSLLIIGSSTSHRLFLPICLMYYYSLQIRNGIKKNKNVGPVAMKRTRNGEDSSP
jgi:hypothetical protein